MSDSSPYDDEVDYGDSPLGSENDVEEDGQAASDARIEAEFAALENGPDQDGYDEAKDLELARLKAFEASLPDLPLPSDFPELSRENIDFLLHLRRTLFPEKIVSITDSDKHLVIEILSESADGSTSCISKRFPKEAPRVSSMVDVPVRANAAQLAGRKIKASKPKGKSHPEAKTWQDTQAAPLFATPGAMNPFAPSTTNANVSSSTSSGLFGSSTFNFVAPGGPKFTFGGNSEVLSAPVSENVRPPLEETTSELEQELRRRNTNFIIPGFITPIVPPVVSEPEPTPAIPQQEVTLAIEQQLPPLAERQPELTPAIWQQETVEEDWPLLLSSFSPLSWSHEMTGLAVDSFCGDTLYSSASLAGAGPGGPAGTPLAEPLRRVRQEELPTDATDNTMPGIVADSCINQDPPANPFANPFQIAPDPPRSPFGQTQPPLIFGQARSHAYDEDMPMGLSTTDQSSVFNQGNKTGGGAFSFTPAPGANSSSIFSSTPTPAPAAQGPPSLFGFGSQSNSNIFSGLSQPAGVGINQASGLFTTKPTEQSATTSGILPSFDQQKAAQAASPARPIFGGLGAMNGTANLFAASSGPSMQSQEKPDGLSNTDRARPESLSGSSLFGGSASTIGTGNPFVASTGLSAQTAPEKPDDRSNTDGVMPESKPARSLFGGSASTNGTGNFSSPLFGTSAPALFQSQTGEIVPSQAGSVLSQSSLDTRAPAATTPAKEATQQTTQAIATPSPSFPAPSDNIFARAESDQQAPPPSPKPAPKSLSNAKNIATSAARTETFKHMEDLARFPMEIVEALAPRDLKPVAREEFFAALRLRALNAGFVAYLSSLPLDSNFTAAIEFYQDRRTHILQYRQEQIIAVKRKTIDGSLENQSPSKRTRLNESVADENEQPQTSLQSSSALASQDSPQISTSSPSQLFPQSPAPSANQLVPQSAERQPRSVTQWTSTTQDPSPRSKRKADVQLTKDDPTGDSAANGNSQTANRFKEIIEMKDRVIHHTGKKLTTVDPPQKPNPFASLLVPPPPTQTFTAPSPANAVASPSTNPSTTLNNFSSTPAGLFTPSSTTFTIAPSIETPKKDGTPVTTSNIFAAKPAASSAASPAPSGFNFKPNTSSAAPPAPTGFVFKPTTSSAASPAPTGFVFKPTTPSGTSSNGIKPPNFDTSTPNFLSQFGQKAEEHKEKAEKEALQRAIDEDYDSDDDNLEEFKANWLREREKELKELQEAAKKGSSFVVAPAAKTISTPEPTTQMVSQIDQPASGSTVTKPLFGLSASASASSSNSFGSTTPAAAPPANIFGASTVAKPASANIFGASTKISTPTSNIFGSSMPAKATTGTSTSSMFGSSTNAKAASSNFFSMSTAKKPDPQNPLGAPAPAKPDSGAPPSTSNMFGFGNAASQTNQNGSGWTKGPVPGMHFLSSGDATNPYLAQDRSGTSTPGPTSSTGSVFDSQDNRQHVALDNPFAKLSSRGFENESGSDDDEYEEDRVTREKKREHDRTPDSKDPEKEVSKRKRDLEDSDGPRKKGTAPANPVLPAELTVTGDASAKKPATSFFGSSAFASGASTPNRNSNIFTSSLTPSGASTPSAGGLFDRITRDSNGDPVRQLPVENKENAKPASNIIFGSTNSFGASAPVSNPFTVSAHPSSSADNTWKQDTPIKFGASTTAPPQTPGVNVTAASVDKPADKPADSLGAAANTTTAKPGLFSGLNAGNSAPASAGFSFGSPSAAPSLFASAAASMTNSRATTPGATTDNDSIAASESNDPDAEHHEQINLAGSNAGEEDEDVLYTVRAKALKFIQPTSEGGKAEWVTKGLGPLKILKNRLSGANRILMRSDPAGTIVMNKSILPQVNYESTKKTVKLLTADDGGKGLETWLLQVKTEDAASELAKILQENKG